MLEKYVRRHHFANQIIREKDVGVMTKRKMREIVCLISHIEPTAIREDLIDEEWRKNMEEEID